MGMIKGPAVFLAQFAGVADGLARLLVPHEFDVTSKARRHLQRFVRVLQRDGALDELRHRHPHARDQTADAPDDLPEGFSHS